MPVTSFEFTWSCELALVYNDKRAMTSSVANRRKPLELHASSVTVDLASSRIFLPTSAAALNQNKIRLH
jgi:hypothetical protein